MSEGTPYEKFIKVYRKSEVVFEENSIGNEMFIVCSGKVKIYTEPKTGRRTVLAVLKPGQHFGEIELLHKSSGAFASIRAALNSAVRVLTLNRQVFTELMAEADAMREALMQVMHERLAQNAAM